MTKERTLLKKRKTLENLGERRVHNAYVSTPRLQSSVRNEIILASIEFLTRRLDEDQHAVVQRIQGFMGARTAVTMIDVVRQTVEDLF